jgi:hypothetical protein
MYNKEQSNRSSAVLLIGLSILTGASRYFLDFTIASSVLASLYYDRHALGIHFL